MATTSPARDRRRFLRIQFDGTTRIILPDSMQTVELLDLSLKGALIHSEKPLPITPEQNFTLRIDLAGRSQRLVFDTSLVRAMDQDYGLRFDNIDLDTLTHLRRLMELNLGDENLLERELEQLFPA